MAYAETIWNYFIDKIGNEYGVAGLMGNLYAESGLRPNNAENQYVSDDDEYTRNIDNGTYTKEQFVNDRIGYGLAQWTFSSRKKALYELWKSGNYDSISSIQLQMLYLFQELQNDFPSVLSVLKSATSIKQASDKVLHDFENPKVQDSTVENERLAYSQKYYDDYSGLHGNYLIIEDAIKWMIAIANDDSHGYTQDLSGRWGPDYDCSSFVIQAYEQAGCPVKTKGASYTGDMVAVFKECGFKDVTSEVNLSTGSGLKRGDIVWRSGHTECYIGDNKLVGAHINEFGEVLGGQTGDQTGEEIYVRTYKNNPWTTVLRLPSTSSGGGGSDEPVEPDLPIVTWFPKRKGFKFVLFGRKGFRV